ncbi:ACP S-malonyltransferase [Candidatus Legionella polyplacis]|uniref:Malonyl CoA-acyl carrier protein transacylase n=1 Tax=Candidatus Legionella polyplacis TaxID=2005262 RepID=A0ABZ2GXC4_9GAMM
MVKRKIAFVFPGQGSQSIKLLHKLESSFPMVKDLLYQISECIHYNIWDLITNQSNGHKNKIQHTQLIVLISNIALFKLLEHLNLLNSISYMAGHSVGEYSALFCSNAISLNDVIHLVIKREKLMYNNIMFNKHKGSMAVIVGLNSKKIINICKNVSKFTAKVYLSGFNSKNQITISGYSTAVKKVLDIAIKKGAMFTKLIDVSSPSHCPLLKDIANIFFQYLNTVNFKIPKIPIISNVNAVPYNSINNIRTLLKAQLYCPVQWVKTIKFIKNNGVNLIIECGFGNILTNLIKNIDKKIVTWNINNQLNLEKLVKFISKIENF